MLQGLQQTTDYKPRTLGATASQATLTPEEMNEFYARFVASNTHRHEELPVTYDGQLSVITVEVRHDLSRIDTHKAAGPDSIPGRSSRSAHLS